MARQVVSLAMPCSREKIKLQRADDAIGTLPFAWLRFRLARSSDKKSVVVERFTGGIQKKLIEGTHRAHLGIGRQADLCRHFDRGQCELRVLLANRMTLRSSRHPDDRDLH